MSATDELHRKLDERGVTHRDVGSMTFWCDALSNKWCATEQEDDSLHVQCMNFLTPAQAIAATLGSGTCHMETADGCQNWNSCSECGADYYTDQPINFCPNCGAKVVTE